MTTNELPNCPKCGAVMTLKEARNGGRKFYGCSRWQATKCNGYLPYIVSKKEIVKVAAPTNVKGSAEQESIWQEIKNGTQHIFIEAVAGSGKTFTISFALHLLPIGLKVIFLAFNKHIAEELESRVPEGVLVKTLHQFGNMAVRKAFPRIKLDKYKLDGILERLIPVDRSNRESEAKNVFLRNAVDKIVRLIKYNLIDPKDIAALDNLVEHYGVDLNSSANEVYTLVNTAYKMSVADTKVMDFDDMIYFVYAHKLPVETFEVVLGDEAQDWNKMQQYLVSKAVVNNRFIGVGDRYQSIYGFAGADVNSIPNLIEMFSNTPRGLLTMPLSQTRRCPITHVALAQSIVPHITALDTAIDGVIERMTIADAIKSMQSGDMGISRRNAPLITAAYKLLREGKRVVIKGRDFGAGIINLINKLHANTIVELIEKAEIYRTKESEKLLAKGKKGESQLVNLNDKIDTLIALTEDQYTIDAVIRKINTLFNDDDTSDAITLSSVHRAKGLEAKRVYIIDSDRLMIPMKQDWANQQELNLAYVAYTRSKHTLVLVESEKK